jgi:hypothetical protein
VTGIWRLFMNEGPDVGERPAGPARQADSPRISGDPEGGDERDPDDCSEAAVQDAEPVAGLGWLGEPVADDGQDRYLYALLAEQPGSGHCPARGGHRVPGDQQNRAARGSQRTAGWAGPSGYAHVPGGIQQGRQGGHSGTAVRAEDDDLAGRCMLRWRGRCARVLPGSGRLWIHEGAASFLAWMNCAEAAGRAGRWTDQG